MTRWWLGGILILVMLAVSLAAYPYLPEQVPLHWNFRGEPDRWGSPLVGAFVMPLSAIGVWLLLLGLPRIDPRRANYARFGETYWRVVNLSMLFFVFLHGIALAASLGWNVAMDRVIWLAVGLFFVALGNVLPRVRSNWWMGIRTPWTLDSERVWRETHRVGGWTFVVGGLITMLAAALPATAAPWVALGGLTLAALVPVVYSYLSWRRGDPERRPAP
jgi:uncharacterized membrane protein